MAKLIARKGKFSEFSNLMAPHIMIDGKGGDFSGMMSPNDPFFWLHDAYIDKLWNDWQHSESSGKRMNEYNGKHCGKSVSQFDLLKPWNIAVQETFDIEKDLFYRYEPYSRRKISNEEFKERESELHRKAAAN